MGSEQFEYRAEEEAELLGGILSFLFRGFPAWHCYIHNTLQRVTDTWKPEAACSQ